MWSSAPLLALLCSFCLGLLSAAPAHRSSRSLFSPSVALPALSPPLASHRRRSLSFASDTSVALSDSPNAPLPSSDGSLFTSFSSDQNSFLAASERLWRDFVVAVSDLDQDSQADVVDELSSELTVSDDSPVQPNGPPPSGQNDKPSPEHKDPGRTTKPAGSPPKPANVRLAVPREDEGDHKAATQARKDEQARKAAEQQAKKHEAARKAQLSHESSGHLEPSPQGSGSVQAPKAAEQAKKEADAREAAEQAKKDEHARQAAEQVKKEEQDRQAAEQAKKEEQDRQAAEQAKKEEQDRQAAEQAKKEEQDRQAAEQAKKEEQDRQAAEQAKKDQDARATKARKHSDAGQAPRADSPGGGHPQTGSTSYSASSQSYSGDATFYATGLGSCGKTNNDNDLIVAVSRAMYAKFSKGPDPNQNPVCGRRIRATYNGKSVDVTAQDLCMSCSEFDLDFSPAAFKKLGQEEEGRLHGMTWNFV